MLLNANKYIKCLSISVGTGNNYDWYNCFTSLNTRGPRAILSSDSYPLDNSRFVVTAFNKGRANEGSDMVWHEWHKQGKVLEAMWDDGKGRESNREDVAAKRCGQKGVAQ
ncbi:hypothetical protein HETIRDRAFT_117602 [Heterobasidion irregulare TC 32-1]|uniref:Uncharacterized protein n=1 Tax=Heterobasidion irregulare (strain TC 32-1) TaxID=747525 RepID=W4K1E3_HETIT|nr:uncharacterized protein HETIRDRAFT_117602 [Heterobasidion irregulare TC 32-1]ETW78901.1 hypothetical protein HETIRDRAFT_117602 [Heterobasidion irregulare TC 32-1]